MGCNKRKKKTCSKGCSSKKQRKDCICDIVRRIIDAQHEVRNDCHCDSSCHTSIEQLRGKKHGPRHTTIPFMLYDKCSCEPFIGSGVSKTCSCHRHGFECIESPIFRAKHFAKGSKCCVNLELLLPISDGYETSTGHCSHACAFFPDDTRVTDFQATGVCITVDLSHFFAITCLDPITPWE
ncbi:MULTISPECIES: CotY/CotZ family spore coat protein [Virgibacillus]|uniref:Spore coat protein Y n=1 Tax=Virgibacillus massiliensis TaxID=1462526 RepID=A0A024QEU3_9BACI|nr:MULTISPECIES: CotY/CotZ family spore coat protein [Virgibacillus]EQB38934.1 hypothetical protein M948_00895 [Virgibacillus sp. CM-4]MYL43297.1 spore coat protein [Virgibacillus massiliensis]CDQ41058.1 Spore coat protein Y [Virgibacillus massiliensis]